MQQNSNICIKTLQVWFIYCTKRQLGSSQCLSFIAPPCGTALSCHPTVLANETWPRCTAPLGLGGASWTLDGPKSLWRLWELLVHWFFAGSCWQYQMYMELFFNCLSLAICWILPAVFMKITSSLLASVQFKPILRRAVVRLPEPLREHLEICLLVLVTKMLSCCLLCPCYPCSTSTGRSRGWILSQFCFASGTPLYVVYLRGGCTAKAASRWCAAMRKLLFSAEAAHLSDPKVSLQISVVVRKTLRGKSLGDIHWPYCFFSSPCSCCLSRDSLLIASFPSKEAFLKGKSVILKVEDKRNGVAE